MSSRPLLLVPLLACLAPVLGFGQSGPGAASAPAPESGSGSSGGGSGGKEGGGVVSAHQDGLDKELTNWRKETSKSDGLDSGFVDEVGKKMQGRKSPFTERPDAEEFEKFRHSDEVEDFKHEMNKLKSEPPGSPQWHREYEKIQNEENRLLKEADDLGRKSPGLGELAKAIDEVAQEREDQFKQRFPGGPLSGGSGPNSKNSWIWGGGSEEDVRSGADRLSKGDVAGAQQAAQNAVASDPTNPQAYLLNAVVAAQSQDYPAAASAAQAALAIDPNNRQAQVILGLTQGRDGGGAASAGQQASGGDQGAGGGAAASAPIGASLGASPQNRAVSGVSAQDVSALLKLQDFASAREAASRSIAANPNNSQPYYYRSVANLGLKDFNGAVSDADAGLLLSPKSNPLLDAKADALNRMGQYNDSLGSSSESLEIDPKDAVAYYNRGVSYFGLKDRDSSVAALRQAASLNPVYQDAAEKASSAPSDADLSLLLPDGGAVAPRPAASPLQRIKGLGVVAISSAIGGLLLALGLIQLLMAPVKSAFTKLTRRGGASFNGGKPLSISPLASDGSPGLLRGQYQVLRQIGSGGMGVVYEGRDVSLERKVAVKRMREELKRDPRERQRFLSEAKLVAALHHPNIVDIYAIVEEADEVYLVFEHIAGKTVHELLGAKGKFSFDEALGLLRGVAQALDFAHARGIIHRDLKPSNIMLDDEGRPRVMDFGIARAAKDALTRTAMTNTVVGTPPYMAPEQEQGVVRKEADVYALGVCFYEMLTGRLPFSGTGAGMLLNKVNNAFAPLSTVQRGLPEGLDSVMAMALNPDPAKRFGSAKQLVDALDGLRAVRRAA